MDINQPITTIQQTPRYSTLFKDLFMTSGIANFVVKTILSPLQRWKIITQTQNAYPLRPKKFKNFLDFIQRVPKEQGIQSLWRGNMAFCWMHFYQVAFQIFLFDSLKEDVTFFRESYGQSFETSLFQNGFFPLFASILSLSILHPLDTYRVKLSMSYHNNPKDAYFTKFRHFFSYTKRQQSFTAIYRGFILANVISFLNFHIYFNLAKSVTNETYGLTPNLMGSLLAIVFLHPLDTIKKIMQLNNMSKPAIIQGYRSTFGYIQEHGSLLSLYNGFTTSLLKYGLSVGLFYAYSQYSNEKAPSS